MMQRTLLFLFTLLVASTASAIGWGTPRYGAAFDETRVALSSGEEHTLIVRASSEVGPDLGPFTWTFGSDRPDIATVEGVVNGAAFGKAWPLRVIARKRGVAQVYLFVDGKPVASPYARIVVDGALDHPQIVASSLAPLVGQPVHLGVDLGVDPITLTWRHNQELLGLGRVMTYTPQTAGPHTITVTVVTPFGVDTASVTLEAIEVPKRRAARK